SALIHTFFLYLVPPHRFSLLFPTRRSSDLLFHGDIGERCGIAHKTPLLAVNEFFGIQINGARNLAAKTQVAIAFIKADTGASGLDRKSTRLNSIHVKTSYAVFCLKKKKTSQPWLKITSTCRDAPRNSPTNSRRGPW